MGPTPQVGADVSQLWTELVLGKRGRGTTTHKQRGSEKSLAVGEIARNKAAAAAGGEFDMMHALLMMIQRMSYVRVDEKCCHHDHSTGRPLFSPAPASSSARAESDAHTREQETTYLSASPRSAALMRAARRTGISTM